jgi:hypothetical protein
MHFVRHYRIQLIFAVFLVFCSVMVVRQFSVNQSRHIELREAFILLYSRGYDPEARILYKRLLSEVDRTSAKVLYDDFQRTLTLVDPYKDQSTNLLWEYHWTISNELENRGESSIQKALKLAREK